MKEHRPRPFRESDPLARTRKRWEQWSRPRGLGEVLDKLDQSLGGELLTARIVEAWPALVGREIASLSRVESLRAGTLIIAVRPGPWRDQLLPLAGELTDRLNHELGRAHVRRIRFLERTD